VKGAATDAALAVGIVVVLAAAFLCGVFTNAGVIAAQCERNGRAIIGLTAFTCAREQPR
jgi:hypothetical protein